MSESWPNVALIRHGAYAQLPDTPSALQPFALTSAGEKEVRQEAGRFAALLSEKGWRLHPQVHSSNALRAWQTARIYLEELADLFISLPEHTGHDALAERSVGCVANLTVAQIDQILAEDPRFAAPPADWKSNSHYCLPLQGAESLMQAGERVAAHLDRHLDRGNTYTEQPLVQLFFGHGASFRHGACHLGVIKFCDIARLSMFHGRAVILQPGPDCWQQIAGSWKERHRQSEAMD